MTINTNNQNPNVNQNEVFTPTVRSAYKFFNSNSSVDNTAMSFSYWNSLLKITINPIIVKEDSANKVDTNNHIDIYLSPSKATMFLHCIQTFRKDPDKYKNIGVNTNKGIIFIANGKQMFGCKGTFIVINLINNETGAKEAEAAYEINSKDFYAIADYEGGSNFSKYYDYSENIELDILENILKTFIEAYTNAVASSYMEANKYNEARMFNFIKDVKEKLGIAHKDISSSNSNYSRSYFNSITPSNNSSNVSVPNNSMSYDEVMSDIQSIMD